MKEVEHLLCLVSLLAWKRVRTRNCPQGRALGVFEAQLSYAAGMLLAFGTETWSIVQVTSR